MTNYYPACVQNVFTVVKRHRKWDLHQHAKSDDLKRDPEVAERLLAHIPKLTALPARLKAGSSDITF